MSSLTTLLAVLAALQATFAANVDIRAAPVHIPLVRRAAARFRTADDMAVVADRVRSKYGFGTVGAKHSRKRASSANIATTNQDSDTSYFAPVTVGTPGQTFNLILDTGSSDLWFASSQCTQCPSGTPEFDTSKSSSFQGSNQQLQISYGSGEVQGTLAQDTVTMGGFTVSSQTMTIVTAMSTDLLEGQTTGIMGLAFETIASSQATPFWSALASSNQLSSQEMSFWLTRFINDPSATTDEPGGAFTLGGTNSTLFTGDIDFVDFPSGVTPTFWLLSVTSLNAAGQSVQVPTGNDALAAIDTGTTLIGAPSSVVQNLVSQIPNAQALSGQLEGFFSFPCSQTLNVTMSFGSNTWPVSDSDINIGPVDSGSSQCVGGIFDLNAGSTSSGGGSSGGSSTNPQWVVGDTFLKNVYSVFRLSPGPSIGFAQLSQAAGGSSGTDPSSGSPSSSGPSLTFTSASSPSAASQTTSFVSTSVRTITGSPTVSSTSTAKVSNPGDPLPTTSGSSSSGASPLATVPMGLASFVAIASAVWVFSSF